MKFLLDLIVGLFRAVFSISMEHPIEEKETFQDVGKTQFDNPDDAFDSTDFH